MVVYYRAFATLLKTFNKTREGKLASVFDGQGHAVWTIHNGQGHWVAILVDGKRKYLGFFDSLTR